MWPCSVLDGMVELCKTYFPKELKQAQQDVRNPVSRQPSANKDGSHSLGQEDEDDEDDEEEEEEEEEDEEEEGQAGSGAKECLEGTI